MPNEGQPLAYLDLLREETLRAGRFGLLKCSRSTRQFVQYELNQLNRPSKKGKENGDFWKRILQFVTPQSRVVTDNYT